MADHNHDKEYLHYLDQRKGEDDGTERVLSSIRRHTGYDYEKGMKATAKLLRMVDDNIPVARAETLEEALPESIRDAMLDNEPGSGFGPENFNLETLEKHLVAECGVASDRAYQLVTTIFDAVREVISPEAVASVAGRLPPDIRQQWQGLRH